MSKLDIHKIRQDYPILNRKIYGHDLVYLDNTATSQTPIQVVEAVKDMYYNHKANVHRGVHCLSQEATDAMELTREKVRGYINAGSTDEIVFTRGATEAINLVASSYGNLLNEGDEIVLTVMEHHSNIVPWQILAERRGLNIKVVPIDSRGCLDLDAYRVMLSDRTRIVAVAHISNVLGTINPVAEIVAEAHRYGAVALVDGAQAVAHLNVDVRAIDADFYVFSSHKMYGPTGIGVLYGKRKLLEVMPPYQGGGEMIGHVSFEGTTWADLPFKFEAGTPDYVDAAAFANAIDYINSLGIENIASYEDELLRYTTERMLAIPGMHIYGTAPDKCAIISFNIGHAHHYDVGMLLDKLGIAVRTGHHCAQPLMHSLGIEGTVRASFAVYNTQSEADVFINALHRVSRMLA